MKQKYKIFKYIIENNVYLPYFKDIKIYFVHI